MQRNLQSRPIANPFLIGDIDHDGLSDAENKRFSFAYETVGQ